MLNETKKTDTCAEKLKYSEGFFYERASQKRGFDIQTQQNHYGKKLHSLFKLAFKSITASRDAEKFMSEVFVYPKSACRIATKRLEETLRELSGRDPIGTFRELRNDHIMQFSERIISDALLTRPIKRQAGIDRMYLLLGERGCGKTTLINYIFLKNRIEFDEKKIIWIRNSVFFKNKPRSKREVEDNFYSHFLEVIEEHYSERLKLNEIKTQIEIWRDKVALLSEDIRLDPNSPQLKKIINESIDQDRNEYAKKIIKYAKSCGYAFIFIIDNIDQYDTCDEIVK